MIPARNPYRQAPFLICVGVLTVSAIGMKAAMHWMGVQTRKTPIPMRKSFDQLDTKLLAPYTVKQKDKINNPDVLESLGTKEYIQWILEDPTVPESSPVRYCSLFITYYDSPDLVPHEPGECYLGGGYNKKSDKSIVIRAPISLNDLNQSTKLPIRWLVFASKTANSWDPQAEFSVLYFFKTNGQYADDRNKVRRILGKNFFCKYSYYSKVEWKFSGTGSPSVKDIEEASVKLMRILFPLLETQHWPDWEKAKQDSASKS